MQSKSFHWLNHHVMSHYTMLYKYGKRTRDFWGRFYVYFSLVSIFWGRFLNETIIPLALVR